MEHTKERRKLALAILISLFLHFVVAYSLAAFGGAMGPSLPLEDKPVELTIVDLSATPPPLVSKDPPFMQTAKSKESAEKPKEQTFESNANSLAASQLPTTGDAPLPTQDGQRTPGHESGDARLFAPDGWVEAAAGITTNGRARIEAGTRGNHAAETKIHASSYPGARHYTRAGAIRHVKVLPAAADQGAG